MPGDTTRLPQLRVNAATHPLIRLVANASRLLLTKWCASVQVRGLDKFLTLLRDEDRIKSGRGILTYANHISVMDDPTIFGSLPQDTFHRSSSTRWTLGASDIMFTNTLFSYAFGLGQVLPTDRGRGVYQPSLDRSIDLLEHGQWVHMFPEGYVNLSRRAHLRRFKWGVGRMLMEAGSKSSTRPFVVPMWISGLDAMMPEPRQNPRWLPRPGAKVTITFGEAVNEAMDPVLDRLSTFASDKNQIATEDAARAALEGVQQLSPRYPSVPNNAFPPTTPLMQPPDGVAWPVPLAKSRSALAIEKGGDSPTSRVARSFIAAELRAHLAQLGEAQGGDLQLVHRLMKGGEEEGEEEKSKSVL